VVEKLRWLHVLCTLCGISDYVAEYLMLSFRLLSDAVFDVVGRKTDVHLLKVLQTEVKPNRHEARIVVRCVEFVCSVLIVHVECLL